MTESIPGGYELLAATSPFNRQLGPNYGRTDEAGRRWRAMRVAESHCNVTGRVHGGLYMSLADAIIGSAIARASGTPVVTMRLTADFLVSAKVGDWLEGFGRVDGIKDGLGFGTAELFVSERLVFTAKAVFKIIPRRGLGG